MSLPIHSFTLSFNKHVLGICASIKLDLSHSFGNLFGGGGGVRKQGLSNARDETKQSEPAGPPTHMLSPKVEASPFPPA